MRQDGSDQARLVAEAVTCISDGLDLLVCQEELAAGGSEMRFGEVLFNADFDKATARWLFQQAQRFLRSARFVGGPTRLIDTLEELVKRLLDRV